MGKLAALKRGITKGVQHTENKLNPRTVLINRMVAKLVCTECGHASNSHMARKPEYENTEPKYLLSLIYKTGSKGSGGFNECKFYYCVDCIEKERQQSCPIVRLCGHESTSICNCEDLGACPT